MKAKGDEQKGRHGEQEKRSRHFRRPMKADEALVRDVIGGRIGVEAGLKALSASGGLPVWTSRGTVIFLLQNWKPGWFVVGDFNGWNPFEMTRGRDGLYYAELKIPKAIGQKLVYRFQHASGRRIADPLARCFAYGDDGEYSLIKKPCGQQYLMRWNDFESPQGLKPRTIHVLVPPVPGPYDVLYAHDGQNLFSPDSICGGWHLCENMRHIGGDFLIVGIFNTEDRMSEYIHAGDIYGSGYYQTKGRKYASFVEETVRPFIESQFQTTGRAGLMGSSLGGLISLYISNCYPGRYDCVFALSPTTAWGRFGSDNGTLIRDYYEKSGHQDTFIYVDHGGEFPPEGMPDVLDSRAAVRDESDWASPYDNCCYTRDFVSALVEIGYRQSVDLFYQHVHGAMHNESAWACRVSKPLSIFMKKRKSDK